MPNADSGSPNERNRTRPDKKDFPEAVELNEEELKNSEFNRISARINSIHPTVAHVLQIHLVIEDEISEILEIRTKHYRQIAEFQFSAKLRVYKALADEAPDAYVYKLVEAVNKLRNTVSHHAWDRVTEKLKRGFENLRKTLSEFETRKYEDLANWDHRALANTAAYLVCGMLAFEKNRLKKERSIP
jgi:hypothetical protein